MVVFFDCFLGRPPLFLCFLFFGPVFFWKKFIILVSFVHLNDGGGGLTYVKVGAISPSLSLLSLLEAIEDIFLF